MQICLNRAALDSVIQSLVLNKITYAVQSYSGYPQEQQIDRLHAMLNKAKKWGLVSVLYNLREILENQDYRMFKLPILNTVLTVYSLQ